MDGKIPKPAPIGGSAASKGQMIQARFGLD